MTTIKLTYFIPILFFIGCVTVKLPRTEVTITKSDKVNFKKPLKPYKKIQTEDLDAAWQNPNNGNSISFLSSCNDPTDPSLKAVRTEVLAKIDEPKIIFSKYFDFNHRKSLKTRVESLVDGYPTTLELIILKKNNCIYILNFIAGEKTFKPDYSVFSQFINGFTVL